MDPVTFSVAVCLSFVLALCGAATNNNNVAINLNPAPASFSVVNYTCDVAAFAVPLPLPLPANVSLGDTPVSSGWQTLSVASPAPSSADVPASSSSPRPCPPHVDVRFTAAVPVSPLLSLPSAAAQRSFATENFFVVESASVTSWSDAAPTASSWKDDAESSSDAEAAQQQQQPAEDTPSESSLAASLLSRSLSALPLPQRDPQHVADTRFDLLPQHGVSRNPGPPKATVQVTAAMTADFEKRLRAVIVECEYIRERQKYLDDFSHNRENAALNRKRTEIVGDIEQHVGFVTMMFTRDPSLRTTLQQQRPELLAAHARKVDIFEIVQRNNNSGPTSRKGTVLDVTPDTMSVASSSNRSATSVGAAAAAATGPGAPPPAAGALPPVAPLTAENLSVYNAVRARQQQTAQRVAAQQNASAAVSSRAASSARSAGSMKPSTISDSDGADSDDGSFRLSSAGSAKSRATKKKKNTATKTAKTMPATTTTTNPPAPIIIPFDLLTTDTTHSDALAKLAATGGGFAPLQGASRDAKLEKEIAAAQTETRAEFWPFILANQKLRINASSWLAVSERVEEPTTIDGAPAWSPPIERVVFIRPSGQYVAVSSKDASLVKASAIAHEKLNGPKPRKTIASVLVYPKATAYSHDDQQLFAYGQFPQLPHVAAAGVASVRVTYLGARHCTPDEQLFLDNKVAQEMRAAAADIPNGVTGSGRGKSLWTCANRPSTDEEWDAHLAETLATIGTAAMPKLASRVTDGFARQGFITTAAARFRGFTEAYAQGDHDAMYRTAAAMITTVIDHCRVLPGNRKPELRAKFELAQSSGLICTATPVEQAPRKPQQLSQDELLLKNVRSAYKLVTEGRMSKASSAMVAKPAPDIAPAEKINALKLLHEQGAAPSCLPAPGSDFYKNAEGNFFFNAKNVSVADLRKRVAAAMNGSAPGPDGWTFELLHDAMTNDEFATNMQTLITAYGNGMLPQKLCDLLAASRLIGIPKGELPSDGIRPLACGSVISKLAGATVLAFVDRELQAYFAGTQFGVAAKGGGDRIIHCVRDFVRNAKLPWSDIVLDSARIVLTFDFANAFNSVTREAMANAVCSFFPALRGAFASEYRNHADLHVVGAPGEKLCSAMGARQGTVTGPAYFATTIQPLVQSLNALPGVTVMAYLDDITVMCADARAAVTATNLLIEFAAGLGLKVKVPKCEVLVCDAARAAELPRGDGLCCPLPPDESVSADEWAACPVSKFRCVDTLKLLGSSIGRSDEAERVHLEARMMTKGVAFFSAARLLCSPQILKLVKYCGVTQIGHAVRTHAPAVTANFARHYDAHTTNMLLCWCSIPCLAPHQRLICAVPECMGGLGLTCQEFIAPAAYLASSTAALSASGKGPKQSSLCQAMYGSQLNRACETLSCGPALRRHTDVMKLSGSLAGAYCTTVRVSPDVYGCFLRTVLMAVPHTIDPRVKITCPACNTDCEPNHEWNAHASSCTIARGGHVTKRHNALKFAVVNLMTPVGYQPTVEPRFRQYRCPCSPDLMDENQWAEHRRNNPKCKGRFTHITGPDVEYYPPGETATVVIDFTVRCPTNKSNATLSLAEMEAKAVKEKFASYGDKATAAGSKLLVAFATSTGHLSKKLDNLIAELATANFLSIADTQQSISARIAYKSAAAVLHMEELAGVRTATNDPVLAKRIAALAAGGNSIVKNGQSPFELIYSPPVSFEALLEANVSKTIRDQMSVIAAEAVRVALAQEAAEAAARRIHIDLSDAGIAGHLPDATAAAPAPAPDADVLVLQRKIGDTARAEQQRVLLMGCDEAERVAQTAADALNKAATNEDERRGAEVDAKCAAARLVQEEAERFAREAETLEVTRDRYNHSATVVEQAYNVTRDFLANAHAERTAEMQEAELMLAEAHQMRAQSFARLRSANMSCKQASQRLSSSTDLANASMCRLDEHTRSSLRADSYVGAAGTVALVNYSDANARPRHAPSLPAPREQQSVDAGEGSPEATRPANVTSNLNNNPQNPTVSHSRAPSVVSFSSSQVPVATGALSHAPVRSPADSQGASSVHGLSRHGTPNRAGNPALTPRTPHNEGAHGDADDPRLYLSPFSPAPANPAGGQPVVTWTTSHPSSSRHASQAPRNRAAAPSTDVDGSPAAVSVISSSAGSVPRGAALGH